MLIFARRLNIYIFHDDVAFHYASKLFLCQFIFMTHLCVQLKIRVDTIRKKSYVKSI